VRFLTKSRWIVFRQWIHVLLLVGVTSWWTLRDMQGSVEEFSFLWLPIVVVALIHFSCYSLDRTILERRWTIIDLLRLACWRTVSPTVALLCVAEGFEGVYSLRLTGSLWLVSAAILALLGTIRLRIAEGMKFQEVKSGAAYKRAFVIAKNMRANLKRVYVVPAGRGHLANAFGMRHGVALTDNYGKFLGSAELDFVIGHELGHVKGQHAFSKLATAASFYTCAACVCLLASRTPAPLRPFVDFCLILGPVLAFYYWSRRHEYAADRAAVEFTHDPETGIRALASLYRITQAPTDSNALTELFMTHPSFRHRAQAIALVGKMPHEHLDCLIRDLVSEGRILE
jgi:Zn-dependent protease with chaperone function